MARHLEAQRAGKRGRSNSLERDSRPAKRVASAPVPPNPQVPSNLQALTHKAIFLWNQIYDEHHDHDYDHHDDGDESDRDGSKEEVWRKGGGRGTLDERVQAWTSSTAQTTADHLKPLAQHPAMATLSISPSPPHPRTSSPSARRGRATSSRTSALSPGAFTRSIGQLEATGLLLKDGVLPPHKSRQSVDHEEIRNTLSKARRSLSPSVFDAKVEFAKFAADSGKASNEQAVMHGPIKFLTKGHEVHDGGLDTSFIKLERLNDTPLPPPKPDFWDGADSERLSPAILAALGPQVNPCAKGGEPNCPNFALEAKGPDGTPGVLLNQILYNGAVMARGKLALDSFPGHSPIYHHRAQAFGASWLDGTLKLFATHTRAPTEQRPMPTYHTNLLDGVFMLSTPEAMVQGMTLVRNLRDYASVLRNKAIDETNKAMPPISPPSSGFVAPPSDDAPRSKRARTETPSPIRTDCQPIDNRPSRARQCFELLLDRGFTREGALEYQLQQYLKAGHTRKAGAATLLHFLRSAGENIEDGEIDDGDDANGAEMGHVKPLHAGQRRNTDDSNGHVQS